MSATFEQILERDGILTYRTQGRSMEPLLHELRDVVSIRRKDVGERCALHDVVLYRRGDKYVLHRIVEVRDHDYVILGDNCFNYEAGIKDSDILGVMIAFVRKGRSYTVEDPRYLKYVRIITALTPTLVVLRRLWWRVKQLLKKIPGVTRIVRGRAVHGR